MYGLTEPEYVLICQIKEKKNSKRAKPQKEIKNGLVEGLQLFSMFMFILTNLSRYIIKKYF